jgi:hypothetical protein
MSLTTIAFLIAFFGGIAMCIWRGPVWGLYTYLGAFYLHPPSRWWGQALPDLRWSLFAATVTLACVLFHKRNSAREPFLAHGLTWIIILYVLWMWVQLPWVISPDQLTGVVLFTKYILLLYLIYEVVDSQERIRDFLVAHLIGCFYLGYLALVATGGGRLEGVGGPGINDSNTMSMHLCTAVIIGSMLLMTEKGWRFWAAFASIPLCLNGMVQGGSRGALIGMVAGGLVLFWLKPPTYRKQFLAFGALGAVLFSILANDVFIARMSTLQAITDDDKQLDNSAESRIVVAKAELQMFIDHPFGAGHAGTAALSPDYMAREWLAADLTNPLAQPRRSSHNTFTSIMVDQGIPGLVLLFSLLVWVYRACGDVTRRSNHVPEMWGYGAAIAGGLTVAVVAGQFAPYLKAEVQFWLLGLLMCMRSLTPKRLAQKVASPTGHVLNAAQRRLGANTVRSPSAPPEPAQRTRP